MKIKNLLGLFVQGTIKTGATFLGRVEAIDDEHLFLVRRDGTQVIILISEIAAMSAKEYKEEIATSPEDDEDES